MSLTQDQITHLAKLTSLKWDSLDISSVIDSFERLGEIDTKTVGIVWRSGRQKLGLREDTISDNEELPDMLLACSGQKKAAHQIVLSGIMQGE